MIMAIRFSMLAGFVTFGSICYKSATVKAKRRKEVMALKAKIARNRKATFNKYLRTEIR